MYYITCDWKVYLQITKNTFFQALLQFLKLYITARIIPSLYNTNHANLVWINRFIIVQRKIKFQYSLLLSLPTTAKTFSFRSSRRERLRRRGSGGGGRGGGGGGKGVVSKKGEKKIAERIYHVSKMLDFALFITRLNTGLLNSNQDQSQIICAISWIRDEFSFKPPTYHQHP